ncbi:MAG: clan AA aspartic protease [Candidatus Omnitrophica bacterium]|nr:clan AA aspartic protease [Candidatus Omnitrophota bacterium]
MVKFLRLFLLLTILSLLVFIEFKAPILTFLNDYFYSKKVDSLTDKKISLMEDLNVVIVKLKSGGKIFGVIEEEKDTGMILDLGYGKTSISKEDIVEIITPSDSRQKEALISDWKFYSTDNSKEKSALRKVTENEYFKRFFDLEAAHRSSTTIRYTDRSRIIVTALINNRVEARLLLDTGASIVVISPYIAEKLHMDTKGEKPISIQLADKSTAQCLPIQLVSIKVGNVSSQNVKAAIMIEKTSSNTDHDGLLGMSFLRDFHIKIDPENNSLVLQQK